MPTIIVPLEKVKLGHEMKGEGINARKKGRTDGIAALAANIEALGLLEPPTCQEKDGLYYVANGNRRLMALREIAKNKRGQAINIPINLLGNLPVSGLEVSMATAAFTAPMHPVDRFEVFSEMKRAGASPEDIAKRYSLDLKAVAHILRLATLSPKVREAWRNGELTNDAAEAFLSAPSEAMQEKALASVRKSHRNVERFAILDYLKIRQRDSAQFLTFVGADAFESAGGVVSNNLFGDDVTISDHVLLKDLAEKKLAGEVDRLKADGWSWASTSMDLGTERWALHQMPKKGKRWTPEEKAKSGAVVSITHDGKLQIELGMLKPGQRVKAEPAKPAKGAKVAAKKPAELSQALTQRLSHQLIAATRDALKDYAIGGDLAVVLNTTTRTMIGEAPFYRMPSDLRDALPAIRRALPPEILRDALRKKFDAEDYFHSCGRSFCAAAVLDVMGKDHAAKVGKMKKADAAQFCMAHVDPTGWLPPIMSAELPAADKGRAAAKTTKAPKGKERGAGQSRKAAKHK